VTAPITGNVDDLTGGNGAQVLRLRKMAVLMAPESAPALTSIVSADGTQLSIPADYRKVGYLGKDDGATLTPGQETSDSTAYGQSQPISQYVTSTSFTAGFTMKETHKAVLEAYYGMDLSAIKARATTREITWDVPDTPEVRYMRILIVGQHRDGADAIWVAQFMPRSSISDIGEQTLSETEDYVYPVTYTALVDSTLGTSRRPFIAGPGLATLGTTPMGFQVAA
jgi:hypothetical protein